MTYFYELTNNIDKLNKIETLCLLLYNFLILDNLSNYSIICNEFVLLIKGGGDVLKKTYICDIVFYQVYKLIPDTDIKLLNLFLMFCV